MAQYKSKNDNIIVETYGRRKKIYYSSNDCYFMMNKRRFYLSNIPSLIYPLFIETKQGTLIPLTGVLTLSNTMSLLIDIDENTETVQLYKESEVK